MALTYSTVSIDTDYLDALPCLVDSSERWNGWACPFFGRVAADRIVRTVENDDYTRIFWDGDTVVVVSNPGDPTDEYVDRIDGTVIDGVRYWPIGAYSWTWSVDRRDMVEAYTDPAATMGDGWRAFITTEDAEWHAADMLAAWDAMTADKLARYAR